jgi:hypothetical protein
VNKPFAVAWRVDFGKGLRALFLEYAKADKFRASSKGELVPLYDVPRRDGGEFHVDYAVAWRVDYGAQLRALFSDYAKAAQYSIDRRGILIPLYQ